MEWKQVIINFKQNTGSQDALGNPIYTHSTVDSYKGRFTEFNENEYTTLGYETIKNTRKIIVPEFPRQLYRNVEKIIIEGESYKVTNYKDLHKYGLFYISRYR